MATWTDDDLKAIEAAIASGALRVEYNDRTVVYRSIEDLMKARELIMRALGKVKRSGRVLAKTSKGIC